MQSLALDTREAPPRPSSAASSAPPSRCGSFENNLSALHSDVPAPHASEFSSDPLRRFASKDTCLENPMAQLLQIRANIRNAPAVPGLPGLRSFPVLAHPALGLTLTNLPSEQDAPPRAS